MKWFYYRMYIERGDKMIKDFFDKYQEELTTHKIEIEEDYELLLSKIKENQKFLQLLREENNHVFSEFTPRDIAIKNKDRIDEVENLLATLQKNKEELENETTYIEKRLLEVQSLLKELEHYDNPGKTKTEVSQYNKIKHDLQNISSFVISDPTRAKIEIDHIIKNIKLEDE